MREAEVRSLARVEKRPSLDSITIDSSNLNAYLAERKFVARESQFASHLDLEQHSSILERLSARGRKKGLVYSKRERDKILKNAEWMRTVFSDSHINGSAVEDVVHSMEVRANMIGPVEHSGVIYFDPRRRAIKASSISIGEPYRSFPETFLLYMKGYIPMVEIHTHPFDSIFSPDDYYGTLLNASDGSRLVKSSIVLCPNIQVLALATRQTPLLDKDDVWKLLDKMNADIEQDVTVRMSAVGALDESALINANLLGVARMLSIKLYNSTDMKHFKEFSA